MKVHRIVADTFIENPNDLPEVNHKDLNRQNNHVDNLEWISHLDNIKHSSNLGRYKKPCGSDNWNYGNKTLKKYYEQYPLEKKKLSRPGEQNGRARKVRLLCGDDILDFMYVGECAKYLLDNNIISNIKYDSLHTRIIERLRTGKPYRGLTFLDL